MAHKKSELIEDFLCFEDFIILETRKNGLPYLVQIDKKKNKKVYIKFNEEAYTVSLTNNNDYKAPYFSFAFSSLNHLQQFSFRIYIQKKEKKCGNRKF